MCRFNCLALVLGLLTLCSIGHAADAQTSQLTDRQRDIARQILLTTIAEIKKNYYDPQFHGVDLDNRTKQAEERIRNSKSYGDAFAAIAWTIDALNDSHTFFIPPSRPYDVENGWEMAYIGEKCFITAVKPASDAEKKGLKPGDQVLAIEGIQPTRATLWKLNYILNTLAPRSGMTFVVASASSPQPRTVHEWRWVESDDVMVLNIPAFFATDSQIDAVISRARRHKSLIVDLRGNPGGAEDVLTRLLGGMFEHDIKIADRIGRKERKPIVAKGRGDHAFTGNLIVIVDSRSASCSELFARAIQLEKRGLVVGDTSAGAVMEARIYPEKFGGDTVVMYAAEITASDLIMKDGSSLERRGVTPDVVEPPNSADLAAGRDPQLTLAFQLVGAKIDPVKAGKLFPIIWRIGQTG